MAFTHLNLDIGITPPYEVISILSECGNLEEFVLTLTEPVMLYQSAQPQTPAYLPNLRKLHLHTHVLDHLVKWLAMPVVEDLLLDPMCRWMDFRWRDESVIKFINASKLTLRKLHLYGIRLRARSDGDAQRDEGLKRVHGGRQRRL